MADNNKVKGCKCSREVQAQTQQIEQESFAMFYVKNSNKEKKWLIIAVCIVALCWFASALAPWAYLSQFEVVSEEYNVEQNTDGGGNIADSYVGVNGDIVYGIPKDNTN